MLAYEIVGRVSSSKSPSASVFSACRDLHGQFGDGSHGESNAVDQLNDDSILKGVMRLTWDTERFIDWLISAPPSLATALTKILPQQRTLHEKMNCVCRALGITDIADDVENFIRARNSAIHGQAPTPSQISSSALLESADRILSRLSALLETFGEHNTAEV